MAEHQAPQEWTEKTAVIGATGYLGAAFLSSLRRHWPDCVGTARQPRRGDQFALDLLAPDISGLPLAARGHRAALILAGITGVASCESDPQLTRRVNVRGTLFLARQLAAEGILPIFASSDYVFDGRTGGYADDAPANPTTEYGVQKAEVEAAIAEATDGEYLVVRLSKIMSLSKGDGSLLDEMAATLRRGGELRAASDQVFCPTLVGDLIDAVAALQACGARGIVNVCTPERQSRYELARAVARAMNIEPERIRKISIDELAGPVRRPHDTSMKPVRLQATCSATFTPLSRSIAQVAANWSTHRDVER